MAESNPTSPAPGETIPAAPVGELLALLERALDWHQRPKDADWHRWHDAQAHAVHAILIGALIPSEFGGVARQVEWAVLQLGTYLAERDGS